MSDTRTIHVVTGNPGKLAELKEIFPPQVSLKHADINILEIQPESKDQKEAAHEIVHHKLRAAYEAVGQPVIVEDVAAYLDCLKGFPGPFVKYAEQAMGKSALYDMSKGYDDKGITVTCTMGYYDGDREVIADGSLSGRVVEPQGTEGFGFDFVIVPSGYEQTMAELGMETKNKISHRYKAITALVKALFND